MRKFQIHHIGSNCATFPPTHRRKKRKRRYKEKYPFPDVCRNEKGTHASINDGDHSSQKLPETAGRMYKFSRYFFGCRQSSCSLCFEKRNARHLLPIFMTLPSIQVVVRDTFTDSETNLGVFSFQIQSILFIPGILPFRPLGDKPFTSIIKTQLLLFKECINQTGEVRLINKVLNI